MYSAVLDYVLKIVGDENFMNKIASEESSSVTGKILMIFGMVHEKTKPGMTIRVDFNETINSNLENWLVWLKEGLEQRQPFVEI